MKANGPINRVRRRIMHSLTSSIGNSDARLNDHDVKSILISRPNNRLGNQLLLTPLLKEATELFPGCKMDLFVRGNLGPILFKGYSNVDRILRLPPKPFKQLGRYLLTWTQLRNRRYDLVINVIDGSSSGRLSTRLAHARQKLYGMLDEEMRTTFPDYLHMAKFPVYNLRRSFYGDVNLFKDKPVPGLDLCLTNEELARGKARLDELVDATKPTICFYTFATGAKCYSKSWWNDVYSQMVEHFSARYNLLEILPKENVSQIDFKATSFYSTDLRELTALMANTSLFLGGDSGMMHLASASGVCTLGLFSITRPVKYTPYGHGSRAIETEGLTARDIVNLMDEALAASEGQKLLKSSE
jgi:heptosyltransferase-3